MQRKSLKQVLEEHREEFMAVPGVVGTAVGRRHGEPCILVYSSKNLAEQSDQLPSSIEGYPLEVQVTGEFRAFGPTAR